MRHAVLDPGTHTKTSSAGLLLIRATLGAMMAAGHGWGKLSGFAAGSAAFPDPLGIGHAASMAGAVGAEFFCSILVVLGLGTRLAVLPLVFTMAIAAFVINGGQPWGEIEFPLLYLVPFAALALTGAGSYSLDALLRGPLPPRPVSPGPAART
jgi:putative oxidoreductase